MAHEDNKAFIPLLSGISHEEFQRRAPVAGLVGVGRGWCNGCQGSKVLQHATWRGR